MACLLDLAWFAETDKELVKLRKNAERQLAKYKSAYHKEFYREQIAAIDAFNATQNKGN